MLFGALPAQAASDLQLLHGPDGTWHVIGTGWRPGDQLEVSVGVSRFATYVDGAGDFDVPTGLTTMGQVAVHHATEGRMAMGSLATETNPMAAVLVQGLAEGAAIMSLSVGLLLLGLGIRRWRQAARA
jgi:hypothetical protein